LINHNVYPLQNWFIILIVWSCLIEAEEEYVISVIYGKGRFLVWKSDF